MVRVFDEHGNGTWRCNLSGNCVPWIVTFGRNPSLGVITADPSARASNRSGGHPLSERRGESPFVTYEKPVWSCAEVPRHIGGNA